MNATHFYQDLLALPDLHITTVETAHRRIIISAQIKPKPTPCSSSGQPTAFVHQYDTR